MRVFQTVIQRYGLRNIVTESILHILTNEYFDKFKTITKKGGREREKEREREREREREAEAECANVDMYTL